MTVPTTPVGAYNDNTSADTTLSNIPLLKKDGAFDGRLTGDTATTVGPDGYDNFVIDIAGGTHDSSASLTSSDTLIISYTLDSAGSIDIEEEPLTYSNLNNGFGPDSNLRTHIVSGTGTLTIPASHWSTVVPGDYAFYIMISASTPNGGIGYRGTYHLTLSISGTPNPDPGPPPPTTTSTWNSSRAPTGGDFNDPNNWTPISVPGPTNDVIFNLPGGSSGGVFSNTNAEVRSLTFGNGGLGYAPGYDLLVNAGTFTVDNGFVNYGTIIIAVPAHLVVGGAATFDAPVQNNGGLIDFDGPVFVQGGANSNNAFVTNNGGTTNFAGSLTMTEYGHLAVNSGTVNLNGANNNLVNQIPVGYGATLAINGATTLGFSGSVQLSGQLNVNAGGSVFVNGGLSVINNSGVSVTGGFLQVGGTNSFDVGLSGGELQLMQPGSFHGRIFFSGSAAGSVIDLVGTPVSNVRITPTSPAPGQSGAVLSMTSGTTGQVLAYQLISPGFTYFTAQADGSGGTYLIASPGVPSDLVMRNSGTGALEIYDIGNNAMLGAAGMGAVGLDWKTAGFGGFSGRPGEGDMLMRNTKTGAFYVYDIANNALTSAFAMGAVGLDWAVGGFGDFSGRPNETDMIMRNTKTGALEVYDIAHNALTSAYAMGAVGLDWQIAGFGNFSGRANETDMIMRNTKTGALFVYDIANNALTSAFSMGTIGLDWSVAGFGSFGANPNESDMLMRNGSTGALEVYDIYGNTIISAASVGTVGLNWQVGGIAAASPLGSTAAANGQAGAAGQLGSTDQLVQAMAAFGGSGGAADGLNAGFVDAEVAQQALLTATQHA